MGQGEILNIMKPGGWYTAKELKNITHKSQSSVNSCLLKLFAQDYVDRKVIRAKHHFFYIYRRTKP